MSETISLINKEFSGKTLSDNDPKHQGRYKVHIPTLMPHLKEDVGLWVKNHVHKYRITLSDDGRFGQYFPLHAGTSVIVKFFNETDFNSGYIDRVVSDHEINSLPLNSDDRDDLYQIIRTPKKDNLFVINEDTKDQPGNSIHLYFNKNRTTFITDEEGIHIYTEDNRDVKITKNENLHVKGDRARTVDQNENILVKGNKSKQTNGNEEILVKGNLIEQINGNEKVTIKGNRTKHLNGNDALVVKGNQNKQIIGSTETISKNSTNVVSGDFTQAVTKKTTLVLVGPVVLNMGSMASIHVTGLCNIKSDTMINVDAPMINFNSGAAQKRPGIIKATGVTAVPAVVLGNIGSTIPQYVDINEKSNIFITSKIIFEDGNGSEEG